ncbi:MAG: hypothetical protein ABIS86_11465, partial [Streptosporangiaceae bacterium]
MVEAAFSSLAYGPAALTVDGYLIGLGLPARPVPLGELREIVLEKNTTLDVRDAVWAHLVGRARADEMWVTACLGMALPGLKAAAGRLTAAHPREVGDDITAEMVTAFIRHLREVDVTKPNICSHLVFRARKQAGRERARHLNAAGHLPLDPVEATTPADHD